MRTALFAAPLAACLFVSAASAQPCPVGVSRPLASGPSSVGVAINFNNRIAVRGAFTTINGQPIAGVAQFDDAAQGWTGMTSGWLYGGLGAGYASLASIGTSLFATSWHNSGPAHPDAATGMVWNGSTWTPAPTTGLLFDSTTYAAFAVGRGRVLVEGMFSFPHEDPQVFNRRRRMAFFDGATWTPVGAEYGINTQQDFNGPTLQCTANFQGSLYVAGGSGIARGDTRNSNVTPSQAIHRWDGERFQPLANGGLNNTVRAMAVYQDKLYVAGDFTATADGAVPLLRIARYTGSAWEPVGGGLGFGGDCQALVVADDGSGEKLHIVTFGNVITAFNQPSPTTDTVNFRGAVRWNGSRYQPYSAAPSTGLWNFTNHTDVVRYDNGTGEAIYWFGDHAFGTGSNVRVTRWGPGAMADTDGDGIYDPWEQNGIDADCDGDIDLNLPAMGANWRHKDLFIEVDSMEGRAPSAVTLQRVIDAFAAAPNALVNNPDGLDGVTLHLIVDPAHQHIPLDNFPNTWTEFHGVKSQWFGSAADSAGGNRPAIIDAKKRVFRYCVFANTYNNGGSSGVAELHGNDFMVTLGAWRTPGGTPDQQAATFMHELGHTLGLFHGGHEQRDERYFNYKPNYHSIMNYAWQIASNRPGWTLDYSRRALPDLHEASLNEHAGIGGDPLSIAICGDFPYVFDALETGPIDWNLDGSISTEVVADINRIEDRYPDSLDTLKGSEDWSHLRYGFRNTDNYASGDSPTSTIDDDTMDQATHDRLTAIYTPPCPADLGGAGGLPGADGQLNNNDFIAFITHFFNQNAAADLGIAGGLSGHDGQFNNNDFIAFISYFFEGCG